MIQHILVPLDGSRLAETVLPITSYLAQHLKARVSLLHIIEKNAPSIIHGERHLTTVADARVYLQGVATSLQEKGLAVQTHVHDVEEGDIARGIAGHTQELAPDLVILSTHGSGGLRDVLVGSIAQQVLHHCTTPLILSRPKAVEDPFVLRSLLIPLDGDPIHEPVLPIASEIARATGAVIHIALVVPTLTTLPGERAAAGMLLPNVMTAILDLAQQGAVEYVRQIVDRLSREGIQARGEVQRGDPVPMLVTIAERSRPDMVALGTHGRSGFDAFWSGSVAPRVLSRLRRPLLLVRV